MLLLLLTLLLHLGPGLGSGSGGSSRCEAARIGTFLTAQDRARPVLLAENGNPIQLRSATHRDPVPPRGSVPAYLAYPLHGGEHLPAGTPVVPAGSPVSRAAAGPLRLDPLVRAQLNAALEDKGMAVLQVAHRKYAVEFVPRYARAPGQAGSTAPTSAPSSAPATDVHASTGTSGSGSNVANNTGQGTGTGTGLGPGAQTTGSGQTTANPSTTSPASSPTPQLNPTIAGVPASQLKQWLTLGPKQLLHWTSLSVTDLTKALNLGGSRAPAAKPGSAPAAQELTPAAAGDTSPATLPAPIPEPTAWLVFGLILGAAGLRQRIRKAG